MEKENSALLGDFNVNLLNFETHKPTEEFINTMSTNFYERHIIKPTTITCHTATLIDNIFFNSLDFLTISGNVIYDLSDHLPNCLIVNEITMLRDSKDKITRTVEISQATRVHLSHSPSSFGFFSSFSFSVRILFREICSLKQFVQAKLIFYCSYSLLLLGLFVKKWCNVVYLGLDNLTITLFHSRFYSI